MAQRNIPEPIRDYIGRFFDQRGVPADPHGNSAHSETFAVDGDAQPPEEHGDQAHTLDYAVDGERQPPTDHGNSAHSNDFVLQGAVGAQNGVAELVSGVVPGSQIPDLAITETFTVAAESELTTTSGVEQGDVGINTGADPNEAYIATANDTSTLSNWTRIAVEQAPVTSVNGDFGDVIVDDPVTTTVVGGNTRAIESDESLTVAGDYTVSGATNVMGVLCVIRGSITGTGRISGTGKIIGDL